MNPIVNRRRWPRLVLVIPPDANDALTAMARDHLRDRKREALRLILEGIAREHDAPILGRATQPRAGA